MEYANNRLEEMGKLGFLDLNSNERSMNNVYQMRGMIEAINQTDPNVLLTRMNKISPFNFDEGAKK